MIQPGHNFAHVTTAQLLWHVQKLWLDRMYVRATYVFTFFADERINPVKRVSKHAIYSWQRLGLNAVLRDGVVNFIQYSFLVFSAHWRHDFTKSEHILTFSVSIFMNMMQASIFVFPLISKLKDDWNISSRLAGQGSSYLTQSISWLLILEA